MLSLYLTGMKATQNNHVLTGVAVEREQFFTKWLLLCPEDLRGFDFLTSVSEKAPSPSQIGRFLGPSSQGPLQPGGSLRLPSPV